MIALTQQGLVNQWYLWPATTSCQCAVYAPLCLSSVALSLRSCLQESQAGGLCLVKPLSKWLIRPEPSSPLMAQGLRTMAPRVSSSLQRPACCRIMCGRCVCVCVRDQIGGQQAVPLSRGARNQTMGCAEHLLCFISLSVSFTYKHTHRAHDTRRRGQQGARGDCTGRCGPGFTPQDAEIRLVSEHHVSGESFSTICKKKNNHKKKQRKTTAFSILLACVGNPSLSVVFT